MCTDSVCQHESTRTYTVLIFFFSSRRRHTRSDRDWSSDVCSSDLLGFAGIHDGSGNRSHPATSPGEVPGSKTADHLRQWTAVHRPRLQGVHSHRGYDARADITLLPAIEWQTGALAQIVKVGVHPTRHTVAEGRCAAPDSNLRGSLQHRTLA